MGGLSLLKESIVILFLMGDREGWKLGARRLSDKPGRVRRRQDDRMCAASIKMLQC